jgi:hypothetical protein
MTLLKAAIIFALAFMDRTNHGLAYDKVMVAEVVGAITTVTQDIAEVETLIRTARWESGGFRKEVANCKVKGDNGQAYGLFQVHPRTNDEAKKLCGVYRDQATIALDRVRESRAMCKKQGYKGSDLLTGYTVGHCVKGEAGARLRWGDGTAIQKVIEEENERLAASNSPN